jgi:hypothetical protein
VVATVAGFQGTVTESQEAGRFARAAGRAVVDTASALKATSSGTRTITLAAGSALVCGVLYTESAVQSIQLPANTASGVRLDIVGLRFTWNGLSSSVQLFSKQGTPGSTVRPALTRTPGGVYEVPIAVVRVRQNITTIAASDVLDVRVWGGIGGPFQASQTDQLAVVDLPVGAQIEAAGSVYRVSANDGAGNSTLTVLSAASNAWTNWDPVLRFQGFGSNPAGTVVLGSGGVRRGRYKKIDGIVWAEAEIRWGTSGYDLGSGDITIDLPPGLTPESNMDDRWCDGELNTNSGDGYMNWPIKVALVKGVSVGRIWAPTAGNDIRLKPMTAGPNPGQPGTGVPYILGGFPQGGVLTCLLNYPTAG